jgi:protein-disulfide isomerase
MEEQQFPQQKKNTLIWVLTILLSSWIIGMFILAAGWLISHEIAKNNISTLINQSGPPKMIDVKIPEEVPTLGNNDAKVTIIEFADFQCPFCAEWHKKVFPELKSKFIDTGKARFVFMDYAFLGEESVRAAEAARCAKDQGKFWEYHDLLYTTQQGENESAFSDPSLIERSRSLNINNAVFEECLKSKKHRTDIDNQFAEISSLGIDSTPTVLINGNVLDGVRPVEEYIKLIEAELTK